MDLGSYAVNAVTVEGRSIRAVANASGRLGMVDKWCVSSDRAHPQLAQCGSS
jgi:hypothetical protein